MLAATTKRNLQPLFPFALVPRSFVPLTDTQRTPLSPCRLFLRPQALPIQRLASGPCAACRSRTMASVATRFDRAGQASASGVPVPAPAVVEEALPDSIHLKGLTVRMLVGVDNWERVKPQPVVIDVQVHTDVAQAGSSDHLPHSIHYGILTKELEAHCLEARYRSLEALAEGLAKVCIFVCKAPRVTLRVQKPRSLLHADSAGVQITRTAADFVAVSGQSADAELQPGKRSYTPPPASVLQGLRLSSTSMWAAHDRVFVKDLCISTILGVNPWERVDKQVVRINLEIFSGLERLRQASLIGSRHAVTPAPPVDVVTRPQNYRTIVRSITQYVESTNYKTVESLATGVAMVAIGENRVERVRVRVDKPSAIMFAEAAGVEVDRDRAWYEREAHSNASMIAPALGSPPASTTGMQSSHPAANGSNADWHVAAIALGSNVGDRFANIEAAVSMLGETEGCLLVDTSFLYETEPKYVVDQPRFVNGACRVSMTQPHMLLLLLRPTTKHNKELTYLSVPWTSSDCYTAVAGTPPCSLSEHRAHHWTRQEQRASERTTIDRLGRPLLRPRRGGYARPHYPASRNT